MNNFSILQMLQMLDSKQISARELTEHYLERSIKYQPQLNGYITITGDLALETAARVDVLREQGAERGLLAGIPVAFKDNLATRGLRTTCASKLTENYVPPFDATVVVKLADSPMLGKANLDEFSMGSANENSAFGPVRNPWDLERVPGGSSGGSAALVAAGCVPFSLGSDTGGSIRQPASFCGVTGFKPTYGRVSRKGLVAFASSLDQVGPITRSAEDCALVLQAICGHDPGDATSTTVPVPNFLASICNDVKGLRIGLPREIFAQCPDEDICTAVDSAARELERAGAVLSWVSMPYEREVLAAYMLIGTAEASSNLARFDGVGFGFRGKGKTLEDMYTSSRIFGTEVRRRIMLGTFALGTNNCTECYERGQRARQVITNHLNSIFQEVDVMLLPTSPSTAFKLGADKDSLAMYYNDIYAIPANLAGIPAVSVPCGESKGLPIGMQFMAPRFREDLLLRAGHTWQCLSDWHLRSPKGVE
jgi:aspartyl-tRNA(Asn)/glutamyl-tRNA(Gln) amidotransferase subunit A